MDKKELLFALGSFLSEGEMSSLALQKVEEEWNHKEWLLSSGSELLHKESRARAVYELALVAIGREISASETVKRMAREALEEGLM